MIASVLMLQSLLDGISASHNSKGNNYTMVSRKWATRGQAVNSRLSRTPCPTQPSAPFISLTSSFLMGRQRARTCYRVSGRDLGRAEG